MGRKRGWPPRVHKHKASGQDRVRWGTEEYYLGRSGSPEARKAYVELIARLEREGTPPADDRPTVGCLVAAWRVHAIRLYGPESQEVTEHDYVLAGALRLFGRLPADQFDSDHLEQLRDAMVASGLARTVVNRRVIRFRTFWRWAERRKLAPKGSWSNLRTLPPLRRGEGGVKETRKVKAAEWCAVAAVCAKVNPSVRGLLLTQWYTGARPGELFLLRAGGLVREGNLAVWRPERHKNAWRGHERAIFFGPQALAAIELLLTGKAPEDLVFPNRDDAPYDRRSYGLAISRAARKAGVKLFPYMVRHAFRLRVGRELGLEPARAALGHASVDTTAGYAAGPDGKLAADVARRLG